MCKRSFFLHVVPEDLEDLPADRRQHGFGGANFHYGTTVALAFGRPVHYGVSAPRLSHRPHPDRAVHPEGDQIWKAEFPVGAVEGEPSPSTAVP